MKHIEYSPTSVDETAITSSLIFDPAQLELSSAIEGQLFWVSESLWDVKTPRNSRFTHGVLPPIIRCTEWCEVGLQRIVQLLKCQDNCSPHGVSPFGALDGKVNHTLPIVFPAKTVQVPNPRRGRRLILQSMNIRGLEMNKFKCSIPNCNCELIEVVRERAYEVINVESYRCICDSVHPIAFQRDSVDYEEVLSHAWLEDDGSVGEFYESYLNYDERDPQRWENFCPDCSDDKDFEEEAEFEEESRKDLPEKEDWTVRCGGTCRTEYAFGWTEPNRGGKIVVVGIDDFDPSEVYPEPRFADNWQELNN